MVDGTRIDRRHFLGTVAMTIAATHFGARGIASGSDGSPRELSALARAVQWINSPRPTASSFAGKVVLVDFCTYTCINWLRTLPYVRAWAQKYRSHGLVVVGVHTPEFPFERDLENVRRATQEMRVDYPIAIDNDTAIWRAFDNEYWPALYLLDARGRIRQHQFGEGEYESSEKSIQRLLAEAGAAGVEQDLVAVDPAGVEAQADWVDLNSSENYVGYARTENFAGPGGAEPDRAHLYRMPSRLALNHWALSGEWTVGPQTVALGKPDGRIAYSFHARDLHLVMGPSRPGSPVRFRVSIDGKPPGPAHGLDVDENGIGTVLEPRLYQLIRQAKPIVDRRFEIEFLDAGVGVYSFTFG
jgi:thiol-disulfide isomerase/thioredoxin